MMPKMTAFVEAGYTSETEFRVLKGYGSLVNGDIVTLVTDYGDNAPCFASKDGRQDFMYLPGEARKDGLKEELEVYKGD